MAEAAEKLREEHDNLYTELTTPERTKSVCEVCGVFVNSTDNEQRRLVRSFLSLNKRCASVCSAYQVTMAGWSVTLF